MTAQSGEILFYKGEQYRMASEPLAPYLRTHKDIHFDSQWTSTDCRRKYIGSWEIKDNKLFLINLEESPVKGKIDLNYIFPNQERVFASWFTGHIRVPIGKLLEYIHMGYASTFEKDIFIIIESGVVVREEIVDNTGKEPFSLLMQRAIKSEA